MYAAWDPQASKVAICHPWRLDTKDYDHMRSHVDFLAWKGFYAIGVDGPGSWKSPWWIELYTATNCIKAVHELIHYFGNRPTLLLGHSLGGSIIMAAWTTNPYVTHMVSLMSPLFIDYANRDHSQRQKAWERTSKRKNPEGEPISFVTPYSFVEDIKNMDHASQQQNLANSKQKKCLYWELKIQQFFLQWCKNLLILLEILKNFFK